MKQAQLQVRAMALVGVEDEQVAVRASAVTDEHEEVDFVTSFYVALEGEPPMHLVDVEQDDTDWSEEASASVEVALRNLLLLQGYTLLHTVRD